MDTTLSVKLTASLAQFNKNMDKALGKVQQVGAKMQQTGKQMTKAVTLPLSIIGGKALVNFDKQIQAENKLAAAVRATGRNAEEELKSFKEFSSGLQEITTVGDESTLQLLSVATQMGLSAEQAKTAAKEAIALSKAMGMNEQSAIRYTAALADGDSTMLNRYLPTLRSIEDDTLRAAKAHELLENMFGAATAEAEAGLGPIKQLSNSFGDFLEEIGAIIVDGLRPLIDVLKNAVTFLQGMDSSTKKLIVAIGSFLAALGPVLAALGFMASTVLPAVVTGFAALTGPIGLAVLAIGALTAAIVSNKVASMQVRAETRRLTSENKGLHRASLELKTALNELATAKKDGETSQEELEAMRVQIKLRLNEALATQKQIKAGLELAQSKQRERIAYLESIGASEEALEKTRELNGMQVLFEQQLAKSTESIEGINDQLKTMGEDLSNVSTESEEANNSLKNFRDTVGKIKLPKKGLALPGLTDRSDQVKRGRNTRTRDEELAQIERNKKRKESQDQLNQSLQNTSSLMEQIGGSIATQFADGMSNAFMQAINGTRSFGEAFADFFRQFMRQILQAIIRAAILAAIMTALNAASGGAAGAASLAGGGFANSFKEMLGRSIGGGGGALPFADGGIVSGPTLGLVGEYSGARTNPEVIAPLDKLKGMLGGMQGGGTLTTEIRGSDLLVMLDRAGRERNRRRGA